MADNQTPESKVSFKDTLNLPRTDFPIRANAKIDDPAMIERWDKEDLYNKAFVHNEGKEKYILHDGPPYANGHLHLGHAYNNVLKDIVTKSQRMFGKHVPVTPGWDCHGLPIELKVTQENLGLDRVELKKACREYAQRWITIQKKERKDIGVVMDWAHPYSTMSFDYESKILKAFGEFVDQGYIERKNKTVPWCPNDQTVLAMAEIEYEDRKDPSLYVMFPLEQSAGDSLFPSLKDQEVGLLVWTTTPWTLALNRAVVLKPNTQYVVLSVNGKNVIVAQALADKVCSSFGIEKQIIAELSSNDLLKIKAKARHPFVPNLIVPVLLDDNMVSLDDGTACVHSAPGCGPIDYEMGIRNNLEIFSPITPDGKYAPGIEPKELEGMKVSDGQIWAIKKLAELGYLIFKTSIKHSYPHCWRCHGGLIFRATKQWFCDLSRDGLKQKSINAIDSLYMIPDKSNNRFKSTLEGRLEWCLSRQRVWGVPIPSLICQSCDYTFINKPFIDSVAAKVAAHGIEYWDQAHVEELLPKDFACPQCKGTQFTKEQDILDVWFESGVSHYAVLYNNPLLQFPADMYLEGKDQHRAWFQSSLLTSMVLEHEPAMKTIMTHGFTVDDKGRKMSKSLGNVVTPQQVVDKVGTDGLRLWASSIDCSSEAVYSETLMSNVSEVFRKIRNTQRFLLSNLYDFDLGSDAVSLEKLRAIDQYSLQQLYRVNDEILKKYAEYDFTAVFHMLAEYCAVDLSAFYLDIIKDRLYVEKTDGFERRSAQTACWYILDTLTKLTAPILSFTAEQVSDHYQKNKTQSIHLQNFPKLENVWHLIAKKAVVSLEGIAVKPYESGVSKAQHNVEMMNYINTFEQQWQVLKEIRSAILKEMEEKRAVGLIKHSLEAQVTVFFDEHIQNRELLFDFFEQLKNSHQSIENFFKEFLIVSQFSISSNIAGGNDVPGGLKQSEYKGLFVKVEHAQGDKCPRCWNWEVTDNEFKLCKRCAAIVGK